MGIKLSKRKLKKGRFSLYLDCNLEGKRFKESLGITLEPPTCKEARQANCVKWQLAKLLRARREIDYLHTHYWSKLPPLFQVSNAQRHSDEGTETLANPNEPIDLQEPDSLDFFLIAASYQNIYHRKDFRMVQAVFAYLKQFHASPLPIRNITRSFCTDFFCFLQDKLHGNTPVNYFKKFKMCLEYCVEENLLPANPARGIRLSQYNDVTKEILSTKELIKLILTPCRNPEVKRAFLFSCQSGLRWCDVQDLCYKNIDFAQRHLTLVQKKVAGHSQKSVLHLHLNENAIRLLQESHGAPDDPVFRLPSHSYSLRLINEWTAHAGLRKHISFHCARHTFITSIMARGASIKTAASLAGHSSTRHTEKYIHIIDKQKQQAVDSLPPLPL